jgi:hypothetical protein
MLPWNIGDCVGRDEVKRSMPSSRHLYVGELIAVDGPEAGAVAFLQVAALAHEVKNDVLEDGVLEGDRVILVQRMRKFSATKGTSFLYKSIPI